MQTLMSDYTDWGNLSQEACNDLGIESHTVYIKNSYVEEIDHGPIGKYLRTNDIDYDCLGIDMFVNLVEFPIQIRDGGGGALILINWSDGFKYQGKLTGKFSYALRIITNYDLEGNPFLEVVDIDIDYNMKRNDPILWEINKGI